MAPPIGLRRPTEADLAEMLDVQKSAFKGNALNERCFPNDPSPEAVELQLGAIRKNLPDITLAVETDSGKILGWARWVRRPVPILDRSTDPMPPPLPRTIVPPETFPANGDREFASKYFQANADNKAQIVGQKNHWFLSTLVVRSEEQGRGVGSMLIRVGTDAADEEGWVAYLNSSPVGRALYETFDFKTVRASQFTEEIISYHMLRDAALGRCEEEGRERGIQTHVSSH